VYKYRNGNKKIQTYEEKTGIAFPPLQSGLVLLEFNDEALFSVGSSQFPARGKLSSIISGD